MKHLSPEQFIALDDYADTYPIRIDLAYAHDRPPNIFGKVYHDKAFLWIYKSLGEVVLRAARNVYDTHRFYIIVYDSLRTVDAQQKMQDAPISQAHPQWFEEPRVLSPPGQGAHPRGMAVDVALACEDGSLLDMGTVFDHLAEDARPEANPAHRAYVHLKDEHRANREILNKAMLDAADHVGIPLHLLETEWWDFRLPASYYGEYAPLSDADLPPPMRMVNYSE
ncbi:MAG: D-Ala-D-Ala dipeptidase [Alphaproteobacteria bacterium]|nr:D-Ala-D-Ala dipeptidase [Alphaproteobacteria bacterium]MCD8525737.1 D-Ala-D-Ala dipeptidase [Alphaproteobacteria bacterium]MCD8571001.1 D-Ala-D-Ala dipeptidase [Alphaproteobacteria bacterium]